jgi:hypothetical protein
MYMYVYIYICTKERNRRGRLEGEGGRAEREGGLKKDQDDQHRLSDQNQMEEGSGFVMAQLESLIQDPTVIFFLD